MARAPEQERWGRALPTQAAVVAAAPERLHIGMKGESERDVKARNSQSAAMFQRLDHVYPAEALHGPPMA